MSSSSAPFAPEPAVPMSLFQYRPTNSAILERPEEEIPEEAAEPEIRMTESSLAERLAAERAAGFADAESKMRSEFERKIEFESKKVVQALVDFEREQKDYFVRVESEVVQLALAIAGKILHREAQVDPMLLTAIVHIALGQLKEGSSATIRVRPEQATRWREQVASRDMKLSVKVAEDAELERGDCILETDLGAVNFSLEAQLKEVERGFFDVLAVKPKV